MSKTLAKKYTLKLSSWQYQSFFYAGTQWQIKVLNDTGTVVGAVVGRDLSGNLVIHRAGSHITSGIFHAQEPAEDLLKSITPEELQTAIWTN